MKTATGSRVGGSVVEGSYILHGLGVEGLGFVRQGVACRVLGFVRQGTLREEY